ncbi:uncharacterized protein [Mytilus edulis]|uniref:uncharacterized protein n=1 Tax=Mytilus edulis TaxID=6550 RepID=UPI0039F093D8
MPEKRHMILCTVTDVRDGQVVYPCCSQCCSKLRSDCFQDRWQCLKCGCSSMTEDLDWRYRLSLMVTDGHTLANICLFGSVLQPYFGMSTNQFVRFLRKIESMYGNSEDILLLGLKHCFIGQHYYFGVKASTAVGGKERICLEDLMMPKRTACQNAMFSQEDSSNMVAFQMVPAINRETKTVYEIIRNFFKDGSEETVDKEHVSDKSKFGSSYMQHSNMGTDSWQQSRSNEQSSITLGQTTALLSCEMSDMEKSSFQAESKNRNGKSFRRSQTSFNSSKKIQVSKSKCTAERSSSKNVFTIENLSEEIFLSKGDNKQNILNFSDQELKLSRNLYMELETDSEPLFSQDDGDTDHRLQEDFPFKIRQHCKDNDIIKTNQKNDAVSDQNILFSKNQDMMEGEVLCTNSEPLFSQDESSVNQSHLCIDSRNNRCELKNNLETVNFSSEMNEIICANSEPLFSQDESSISHIQHKEQSNIKVCNDAGCTVSTNFKLEKKSNLKLKPSSANMSVSLEGSILLQNLKVPDLPEDVPDSEELELYLFDDSSFEFENHTDDGSTPMPNKAVNVTNGKPKSCTSIKDIPVQEFKAGLRVRLKAETNSNLNMDNFNSMVIKKTLNSNHGNQDTCTKKKMLDSKVACKHETEEEQFDGMFEDSFEQLIDEACAHTNRKQHHSDNVFRKKDPNNILLQTSTALLHNKSEIDSQLPLLIKEHHNKKKLQNDNINNTSFDDEDVISCAPELNDIDIEDLSHEFDKNLQANVNPNISLKTCDKINKLDKIPAISIELSETQTDKEFKENLVGLGTKNECLHVDKENSLEFICESQPFLDHPDFKDSLNNQFESGHSLVSESLYLNASEDLFGETSAVSKSLTRYFVENVNQDNKFEEQENRRPERQDSSKKSVKFSRRLSYQTSVQLIDLQMKINSNPAVYNGESRKSCLKTGLEKILEKEMSTNQTMISNIITVAENSPIVNYTNSHVDLSQDLFSPSPDICFKRPKPLQLNNRLQTNQLGEQKALVQSNRHSSTPIESETVEADNKVYNNKSLISIFTETFEDLDGCKENVSHAEEIENFAKKDICVTSPALFSQSYSLFSFSSSKLSERGDNISKSSFRRGNNSISVNYSCDLFSPSIYESTHSPCGNLPVKKLFLDHVDKT